LADSGRLGLAVIELCIISSRLIVMLLILFIDLVISSIIGLLTKDLYPQSNESEDEEENGRN